MTKIHESPFSDIRDQVVTMILMTGSYSSYSMVTTIVSTLQEVLWKAVLIYPRKVSRNMCCSLASKNQISRSVVSDSLQPHGCQHTGLSCPSLSPGVCFNSCPLSQWCHPTISSSVSPFTSCLQSFPASRSFLMSQLFASGGQSIGVSASTSVLPKNIQDWFPLGWIGWISLQPRDSQESSPTPQLKSINALAFNFLYGPTLTSILDYWKNHSFD